MNGCSHIGKRAAIQTLGCRLNQGESRLIEDQLRNAGFVIVPFGASAELGIIHTCVVTREAEAKSRKMIRRFARQNPGSPIVVIGCYAQTDASTITAMAGVRLVLGNAAKMNLAEYLSVLGEEGPCVVSDTPGRNSFAVPFLEDGEPVTRRVNLKIQDGCDEMCSYCYIPFARGRSRSRHFDDAIAEAASLVRRGAKEIVLTGVNLGDYRDADRGLTALVDALDNLEPKPRVRISSIELNTIPRDILSRMANPAHGLVPHLHVPLQSGSDAILKAMGRPYTAAEYVDFVEHAATHAPGIGLGADVMVGFPGETDADFEATCALVRNSPLTYLHVFQYSERKQVAAARLGGKAPPEIMRARSNALQNLGKEKHRAFQEQWTGRDMEVLFESRSGDYWKGHAGNYLEVILRTSRNLENTILPVQIQCLREGYLVGKY
ncbi:MAG TPA: tRNA (N(6)-L-threonylcarbamoyladenosine(37)-C(2))-methylthiotransferase MtaB [Candidatus Hydrogenedentes bacterium]|nr:tRNA (N(6)-L-threonylcarbamoyladenosine(37)-C(2))-methylthiotransferase MtaB [Candidatus Hydrogenedentota bacterium]